MEIPHQSDAASWRQILFRLQANGISLTNHYGKEQTSLANPGNHDNTNALDFIGQWSRAVDPTSMVAIYNLDDEAVKNANRGKIITIPCV